MRRTLAAWLLLPAAAWAGSAFDGTWKGRVASLRVSGKPEVFAVTGGTYTCDSCVPPVAIRADGSEQRVSGHDYYDTLAVKIVDARTLERTMKLRGKLIGTSRVTVSADGATLTSSFTDYTGAKPATGTFTGQRVGPPPAAGAHATSGSWQSQTMQSGNDALTVVSYRMTGDEFTMKANGQSYSARFDGREYPVAGDPAHTLVSLRRLDEHTVIETDKRNGRVTDEVRLAAGSDGKTLQVTDRDLLRGQTVTMTFDRQ
jgi:hypothetical protein